MTEQARLKWHCRRGMRELDLLLEDFFDSRYESLPPDARKSFARLLDCENEELMAWLIEGGKPQDEQLADIVCQILDRKTLDT